MRTTQISETAPVLTIRSPTRGSYITVTHCRKPRYALVGSLVVGLVSVSVYEHRLLDAVGFLVMSLTPLAPTILPLSLYKDSWNFV